MDHGGSHGIMTAPSPSVKYGTTFSHRRHKMIMHMSFFWGTNAEVLFPGWPRSDKRMYTLALVFLFFLSLLVEWLSNSRIVKAGSGRVKAGLVRTFLHALRVGLAYLIMLTVMSFNVGVFLVAVFGHAVGFLVFGCRVFGGKGEEGGKAMDLPLMG